MNYRQCVIGKDTTTTVMWVPETLSKVGKKVAYDEDPDEEVWTILEVSDNSWPEEQVRAAERKYKAFSYGHAGKKNNLPG